jgi:hypothetical protein
MEKKGIPFIGLVLVLVGVVLLASQFIPNFRIMSFWPLIVMAAGAVFLIFGFLGSWGLLIPGMIVGYVGAILMYYNITGNWAFWQFWLLCPSAVGTGIFLHELFESKNPIKALSNSWFLMAIGGVLFTLFLVPRVWSKLWPALLVLAGVMIILQSLFVGKRKKDKNGGDPQT